MAIINCKECKKEISSEAKACPGCGAKPPKGIGFLGAIMIIILVGVIASKLTSSPSLPPPLTAEESKKKADDAIAEKIKEDRFQKTVIVLRSIKGAMREPDSIKWEEIRANDDASVVCVIYRARNGFGGMNREAASYAKGSLSTASPMWRKHCQGQTLNDIAHASEAL